MKHSSRSSTKRAKRTGRLFRSMPGLHESRAPCEWYEGMLLRIVVAASGTTPSSGPSNSRGLPDWVAVGQLQ
jgi:hypothetical protein